MRILIIGAGNAGQQLASRLCEEKHSVVMVDGTFCGLLPVASAGCTFDIPGACCDTGASKLDLLFASPAGFPFC